MVKIKRIYDQPQSEDGYRVLVDRLWPRGISKEEAALDEWLKDIGPSNELRKWFGHIPERFPEFEQKYLDELKEKSTLTDQLKAIAQQKTITLLYSAKDQQHNQAVVLMKALRM